MHAGYWCLGYDSCSGRAQNEPDQVSSTGWGSSTIAGGIFSRDASQNPWSSANMAYVRYCSSDAWMGDTEAFGMQFRGQSIVTAALTDLLAFHGLAPGARLLFGGCSAGARGAMVLLDSVAHMMQPSGIEVRGMLDSAFWIDVQPNSDSALGGSLLEQAQLVYGFANTSGVISAECAAAYPQAPWKCLFGQFRLPLVQTSYFLSQSQFDDMQVDYDCGSTTITTDKGEAHTASTDEAPCMNAFQQAMRTALETLPAPGQTAVGIFSSTCSIHCVTNGPDWWTIQVNGVSMATTLATWYYGFGVCYRPGMSLESCILTPAQIHLTRSLLAWAPNARKPVWQRNNHSQLATLPRQRQRSSRLLQQSLRLLAYGDCKIMLC